MQKTYKQVCEEIESARIIFVKDDGKLTFNETPRSATAQEIYSYSPTGELWMLQEWYAYALLKLGRHEELDAWAAELVRVG